MQEINSAKIDKFIALMTKASNAVIVTHTKPDGDAIGSSVAAYQILKMYGCKKVRIVIPDPYPESLSFVTEGQVSKDILTYEDNTQKAEAAISGSDLIICLDFNAFHRSGTLESHLAASAADKVLIDHHLNPQRELFTLSFSMTEVSSTCELLYNIIMQLPEIGSDAHRIPVQAATALMTGMTTDTNNFANSTFPSTLRMASSLIEAGVDRDAIVNSINNCYGENRMRLMGYVLKDLMKITSDGVAYIILDAETLERYSIKEGDTEGFVNLPLSIEKVRMSILLKEDKGFIRVSVRSKKGISANRCAGKYFNGGGHENAAGGRLYIPKDIDKISSAAEYIERNTHIFFTFEQ